MMTPSARQSTTHACRNSGTCRADLKPTVCWPGRPVTSHPIQVIEYCSDSNTLAAHTKRSTSTLLQQRVLVPLAYSSMLHHACAHSAAYKPLWQSQSVTQHTHQSAHTRSSQLACSTVALDKRSPPYLALSCGMAHTSCRTGRKEAHGCRPCALPAVDQHNVLPAGLRQSSQDWPNGARQSHSVK